MIINAAALPILIPSASHAWSRGIVRCHHQHTQRFISAKKSGHQICRNIPLKYGRQEHSQQKINSCSPYISSKVLDQPQDWIVIYVPACRLCKTMEVKKRCPAAANAYQNTGHDAAEETGQQAHGHCCCSQRRAVDHKLRIQKNGAHHKCCQPIIFYPGP